MITLLSFVCAAGLGLWAGGLMNTLVRRYDLANNKGSSGSLSMRLLAAVVFGLLVLSVNFSVEWLIALPFTAALVIVTICDIRHMVIPDAITLPGIVLAAVLRLCIHPLPYWDYVTAALIGSGLFYLSALAIRAVAYSDAIGGGDIKLLALVGFVLGIKLTILSFLLFCLAGTVTGVLIILTGRFRKDLIIPFGPFIATASIVSYYWGSDAISWVTSTLVH